MKKLSLLFALLLSMSVFASVDSLVVNFSANTFGFPTDYATADSMFTDSVSGAQVMFESCASGYKWNTYSPHAIIVGKTGAQMAVKPNVLADRVVVTGNTTNGSGKVTWTLSLEGAQLIDTTGCKSVYDVDLTNVAARTANSLYVFNVTNNNNLQVSKMVFYYEEADTTVVPVDTTSQDTTPVIVPVTMENLTFNAGVWNQDNAKFGAWVWGENLDAQFTDFFAPSNDSNLYLAQVPETADSIVFVRFADTVTVPAWGNGIVWNQTMNYAVNHADMYFTITDWTTGTWGTPVVITSLADAKLLAVGTEITTTGIVTYINNKNAYIQDATDGILLYGTSNFTNFQVGDEIVIDAKVAVYGGAPELSNVTLRNIVSNENTVNPILMTLAERVANPLQNFGMMITINELTITAYDSYRNPTLSDGTNTAVGYKMSLDTTAFPIGSVVDVTAIAALYDGNLQFQGNPAGVVMHEYPAPLVMDTIIFVPSMWNAANAKVAAWVWGDSLQGMWTEMIALDSTLDEIYEIAVPVLAQNIKFVRFASNVTAPAWEGAEIWNQTGDKVMDFETGIFTITDWNDGIWGTPVPEPVKYYIKNNWNGGAWTYEPMVFDTIKNHWEYTGVYGGTGVNINTVADGEGLFIADTAWVLADSNFVPQYLDTLRFCYIPETEELHVHLMGRPAVVPPTFFIKNKWNGGDNWLWEVMTLDTAANVYEYTGVWGGEGVNISENQDPEYPHSFWFPAESFVMVDSTVVAQAMDTLHFMFTPADTTLMVELVGRPAPAPEVFQIKNNWNGGEEWTWVEMTPVDSVENVYEYTGVFGGRGVDIFSNYMDSALWFPVDSFLLNDGDLVPQAMDTVLFAYNSVEKQVAAMVLGRPAPAPEVFQIKNNWNGGEWTWVEMTPVDSVENVYQYTGIFGGKGVNITSNYMNGELWFPVDSFLLNEGDLVPQYKDTVLFAYNSVENEVAAMVLGRHIFNTCAEVNAITANTHMELGEVTVVFAKDKYIYVEDATATTLVYTDKYGNLKAGDRVWGIAGEAKLYSDLPELAANTAFDKLVVTEGAARAIEDATAAPTTADINKVLMFRNVTMLDSAFTTPNDKPMNINGIFNGDTVAFRNNWKETYTFEEGKTYTMLGCVAIYNGNIQVYVTNFEEYAPVQYYIKNNWNRATDWTWEEMIPANDGGETWMYTGIFGGTGVDINTAMNDEGKKWFAIADMIIPEGNVAPEAGDSVMFVYNTIDETMTATVLSQVIPGEDITVTVWVRNENTNWEHLYVYGWGGAEEIFGAWPGLQLDVDYVLEPDKFDYTNMFHITGDYEGLEENLIFNSGAGQQFPDLKILLTEDAEYYIVITNDGAHFEGEEGLETITFEREGETVKVIMNGQLYIVRDGKVYNALGAQVR